MQLKSLKKFALVLLVLWFVFIVAGLLLSRSFQGKIIDVLTDQADKNLLVEVHIRKSDIHFSLFKKFPLASVELRNIMVKVPSALNIEALNAAHGDTLLYAKNIYLQLNLRSLLKKQYQLQKISMNQGFIQILTDKNGHSSLDIIKPSDNKNNFQTNIQSLSLSDVTIFTKTEESSFQSVINLDKGEVSGTFSETDFSIVLKSDGLIEELFVQGEKLQPMQKYKVDIAIVRSNNTYSINKGYCQISNIPMKILGSIQTGKNTLIDLVLSAQDVSLKKIDKSFLYGLIGQPNYIPKGGDLSLLGSIKGYISKTMPAIKADFLVTNGKIVDQKKDIVYSDIYLKGILYNVNNLQLQKSFSLRLDSFNLKTGNSNQYGNMILTDIQNPEIIANLSGYVDVKEINKFAPIPNISIKGGVLKNRISIRGKLPRKDSNDEVNLNYKGQLSLSDFRFQFDKYKISEVTVNGNVRIENNHSLRFDSLNFHAGNTDLTIDGKLLHFQSAEAIPVFSGSVHAAELYVNDFILNEPNNVNKAKAITFPDSIEIYGDIRIDNFYFGTFSPKNIAGYVAYKNRKLNIDNFLMYAFSGSVAGNVQITQKADTDIEMKAQAFLRKNKLEEMFYGFNNFGQTVISSRHLNGDLSGTIQFSSVWNSALQINKESILATGDLLIEKGEINDYAPLLGLSKFIEVDELKHIRFDNLSTNISIQNKKVILNQTHIASSAINFDGSGIHDFDNKYEYRLQVGLSDILWKKARKKKSNITEFGYVVDDGSGHTTVPFLISGKGTSFDVKYDKRTSRQSFKEKMEQEKKELQDLFQNEQTPNANSNILQGQSEGNKKPAFGKTDSGLYRNQNDEFILDWDDSEDD
jgi:hypothetical protein